MSRIAIDLTPVLPGGANGGAKIMSLELIKKLAELAPEDEFILLALKKNYLELSAIKIPNVKTICVPSIPKINLKNIFVIFIALFFWITGKFSKKILSNKIRSRILNVYNQLILWLISKDLAKKIKADLLFCPFTAPFYRNLNLPIVSVIYDLQYHYHPYFFSPNVCYERKKHFYHACRWSKKLICISNFVKQTIMETSQLTSEKIKTIYIRLAYRLPQIEADIHQKTLNCYNLQNENFLVYPANFWMHKNHQMLFTAFAIYRARNPESTLKLVCTGADNDYKLFLIDAAKKMGMGSEIILPGFLTNEDFASLITSSKGIIFPSLYEGFGMPVLEAMANGKPILCSNTTSLPEIAGSAAILFDPRKPEEIVTAIHQLEHKPQFISELIKLGQERVAQFGTAVDMAKEYLQVFKEVIAESRL